MKAGLITFHRADNYGAVLQASALLKYISKNICKCELIDYIPNNVGVPNNSFLRRTLRFGKNTFMFFSKHNQMVKKSRFEKFRRENYVLSKNTYYGDEMIQNNPPEYDILISGSDQILNLTLSKNSISYYLAFGNNVKKVSYASSFGRNDISKEEEQAICKYLTKFDAISVREKSAIDLLRKYIDKDIKNVMDPVFLMDKEEWFKVADEKNLPKQKYIFVYAMENTEVLRKTVDDISQKYKLPVIKVNGGCIMEGISGKEDKKCGPEQFLAYIKNAEFVITNSFHGMAFSHIFEKNFYAIAHTRRNSRIEDLMNLSGNKSNIISSMDDVDVAKVIDGKTAFLSLREFIIYSKKYLKDSIMD